MIYFVFAPRHYVHANRVRMRMNNKKKTEKIAENAALRRQAKYLFLRFSNSHSGPCLDFGFVKFIN